MIDTAFLSHPFTEKHDMGEGHPESPARTMAIQRHFSNLGLNTKMLQLQAEMAYEEAVLRVHHPRYIEQLEQMSPLSGLIQADPDTLMGPHSHDAAYFAAGAGVQAVNDIVDGKYQRAFCAVRPPGHHAEPNTTMGFCFINNIAVAVQELRSKHDIKRVAVIDFDVHQGNGTVEIFKNIPDVLFCSSFQHPFYPNSHWNIDRPNIINSPIPAFSTGEQLMKIWEAQWLPALIQHKPEFIFISAGFDAHRDDPMAEMNWLANDYHWITSRLCEIANKYADGRVISMLEGGYNLKALAASVEQHVRALLEV